MEEKLVSIGSNADKKDIEGKLDPTADAQRNLVANAATDPQALLSEDADPLLPNASQSDSIAEPTSEREEAS